MQELERISALSGLASAKNELGLIYMHGYPMSNMPLDNHHEYALRLFESAVDLGEFFSIRNILFMYITKRVDIPEMARYQKIQCLCQQLLRAHDRYGIAIDVNEIQNLLSQVEHKILVQASFIRLFPSVPTYDPLLESTVQESISDVATERSGDDSASPYKIQRR